MEKMLREFAKLKNESEDINTADKFGSKLFNEIERRAADIVKRIEVQLARPRTNEEKVNTDDRFAMRQAQKRIDIDDAMKRIFDLYRKNVMAVRNRYYDDLIFRIKVAADANTPGFLVVSGKVTKSELSNLSRAVLGRDISRKVRFLRLQTLNRLEEIVLEAYREVPKAKRDYRMTYMEKLRGAMSRMVFSFKSITRGIFIQIFEDTKTAFFANDLTGVAVA